jgi:hypothetical protein
MMLRRQITIGSKWLLTVTVVAFFLVGTASAQGALKTQNVPAYTAVTEIRLGMSADEVRKTLGRLKTKGERQDFFEFSESKLAQVFYDSDGKAVAISFDYLGTNSGAPTPEAVLGEAVQPKPDGSVYALKRYPELGYWVAFSRTAGDNPVTSITVQKI